MRASDSLGRQTLPWLAVASLVSVAVGQTVDPKFEAATARMVCGPRCLEYVLHWYGRDEDVADLMAEVSSRRADRMASLADIADGLTKRGVYTKTVRTTPGAMLNWPAPIVVHLVQPNSAGHFVVWVPPNQRYPALWWSGDRGFERQLSPDERQGLSGAVLLTAREPIEDTSGLVHSPGRFSRDWVLAGTGVVFVLLVAAGWAGRRLVSGTAHTTHHLQRREYGPRDAT